MTLLLPLAAPASYLHHKPYLNAKALLISACWKGVGQSFAAERDTGSTGPHLCQLSVLAREAGKHAIWLDVQGMEALQPFQKA